MTLLWFDQREFIESLTDAHNIPLRKGTEPMPLHDCDPVLRVSGRSVVEFFNGSGSLTIALSWIHVLAMKPWDIGGDEQW